jgi:CBS-domain-containing membrane protein
MSSLSGEDNMLTIRDIMTEEVFTLSAQTPVEDAAWALAERSISGAPVRDAKGRLVGTLSRADLIDPDHGAWLDRAGLTADVMSPRLLIAQDDQPAMEAVRLMMREELQQIVVTNAEDEVVGIVTPMDVMKALVRGELFQAEPRAGMQVPEDIDAPWETAMTA